VEDGDEAAASRAVNEIVKLKTQTPAPAAGPPPETLSFMEKNKAWMGTQGADGKWQGGDPLARTRAIVLAEQFAAQGYGYDEQLQLAERAIRKEFPEHFPAPAKTPPGVQTGSNRNAGQGSGKKGFADMPPESQAIAKDLLARQGVPLEDFARRYFEQQQRKVG
jgi:hypothetical protein